ncbi:glycosyltransferase [Flavobacterium sp. 2]|uniref:glycosyltransferase n=1 Tax=Flavobacterium sp. 2 TaxID=308053 RepID=UPI003CEE4B7B
MENKKIIFKLGQFPHLSETFILAQIITAIKSGFDVKVIIGKLLDFESSKQQDLISKYEIKDKIILEDFKIPKNRIIRILKWAGLLLINFQNANQIFKYYKAHSKFSLTWLYQWVFYNQFNDAAIFHVQYGTNSGGLSLLKKVGFKPSLIVSFHGHDAFFPINGFIPNNGYYDNLFKYGDLIVANTPYLAEILIELGCPEKMLKIVPVGVDTDFFYQKKIQRNDQISRLITVGRLNIVKGHIYAFQVIKKLKHEGLDVKLTVVGEGPEREKLENYIRDNNLTDSIVLVGSKSRDEIRELLWKNDIFVFSSVSLHNGKSTETQGLVTIEAMACGLPAIVFDSGGVKYTLENGISGFLCDEYDIDCMSAKIKTLVDDKSILIEMGKQANHFANKNYSQKMIDSKWQIIYNKLSNGKY